MNWSEYSPMNKNSRVPVVLSIIVIILSIVTSAGGLFIESLYKDTEVIKSIWFVNDIVTLFLAVPTLITALIYAAKGSLKARLIWAASLWYVVYNYVFYVYGAVFNAFFLFYITLIILPIFSVILILSSIDTEEVTRSFSDRTPNKLIGGFMLFFGAALGIPWIAIALSYILTGQDAGDTNKIVIATDWIFMLSIVIVGGVLLLKKHAWGYILTFLIMIKTLFYPIVLIIGGIYSYYKTGVWDTFIPLYALLWTICTGIFITLLRNMKPSKMIE